MVLDGQLIQDAAVAPTRVLARAVSERRLLDQRGVEFADLRRLLGRVLVAAIDELLPHGNGLMHAAVLEGDL